MMNSKKNIKHYKLVIALLIVMEIFFVFLSIKSFNNKNLDKYIVGDNNKTNKMLAIMLEDENGDYKPYNSETFPEFPYIFNSELSQCMDIKGNTIENAISYDEDTNLANVIVTKTSQCYFYFSRPKEIGTFLTNKLIGSGELWQSGLEGDGYRYVGSGSYDSATTPNNFICFGTIDKTECKNNEAKYLYRIIGVFEGSDGKQHLKLISLKQLSLTYEWHSYNGDVDWVDSDMYTGLNGSYFLTNSTYDYLQNNTWLNKIEDWTWSAVNTLTDVSSADYGYYLTPSEIYLHEMNRSSITSIGGEWTTPTAKIGLMYASDYTLSLGSSALSLTDGTFDNASTLLTGWMHQSNNDTTASEYEWTLSRDDGGGYYLAWRVSSEGDVDKSGVDYAYAVRPVFYLSSDVVYNSGSGTYSDPYTILETSTANNLYESNLSISVQLNANEVIGTITQGEYDLNKYCINTSSHSYENCTWKKIDTLTVTDTLPDYGTYYLHVIDKGGYVVHSKALEYVEPMSSQLISSGELWQSGLEGDGYRYTGSGAYNSATTPNNFICFGTNDKTECKNNESKYMYRIIGVFEGADGNQHLKLISLKQLGAYAWNADAKTDVAWENSDMYRGLNGSYFLTNTTYDYLQNNTWLNKIEDWTWSAVNTKTLSDSGPSYFNSLSPSQIYLHEMNRNSKTSSIGEWSTPTAKIGLMYASDYTLSLGSSALAITGSTSSNASTLKTGWMHQSNNDTTASTIDWTLSRYGVGSGAFRAWRVLSGGDVNRGYVGDAYGARPVFHLISNIKTNSGTGTYTDPYIIKE